MTVDLTPYTKKLALPTSFVPPRELRYDDVSARAITRDDVAEDVRGINASLDLIRETRGGKWPTEAVTEDEIIVDEYWHECEFRDGKSFSFILRAQGHGYIGCAYFYPMGVRRPLTPELAEHDVDISWWVTPDAHDAGYYGKVHEALKRWATEDYPFHRPFYSNSRIP
jgi:RimJ/RimL family protein N-acetyltransferase